MHTLMFVNGLDKVNICCVIPDDSRYGKFTCAYCRGGKLQQYAYHKKCGFNSAAEAIGWYFEMYPNGNVLDEGNFLSIQNQLLELVLPSPQASIFDPTHMIINTPPIAAKKTGDGKLMSDFE